MSQVASAHVDLLSRWIANSRAIENLARPVYLSPRQRASVALLQVCRDHCLSINLLLLSGDSHVTASTLALLRPAFEALLRGGWLGKSMDDDRFERICTNGGIKFPGKKDYLKEFLAARHPQVADLLNRHAVAAKDEFDDFAHGGILQILRRYAPDGSIGKPGTDAEEEYVVYRALVYDLDAALLIAEVMGNAGLRSTLDELSEKLDIVGALSRLS